MAVPWLRRRHETLNEKLLREAGYSLEEPVLEATAGGERYEPEAEPQPYAEPVSPEAVRGPIKVGYRQRNADIVAVTTEALELTSDSLTFTALADGTPIVD